MKNIFNSVIVVILTILSLLYSSCSDDENPITPSTENDTVSGKIILPQGSSLDVNSLIVLSSTDQSAISNGNFELNVRGNYKAMYVSKLNEDIVMIGYKNPGSSNSDISVQSTALGLLMMSRAFLDISQQGKQSFITSVLANSNFPLLLSAVEESIILGNNIFDTTNAKLLTAIRDVFLSSEFDYKSGNELSINMFRYGRDFTFNNSGTAFSTVIGVYNNNKRIHKIDVKGLEIVPSSLTELFSGGGSISGIPQDYQYTLSGDDNFMFKFRTGKPGFGDNSIEHDEAFKENLTDFSLNLILTILPIVPDPTCLVTISSNVYNTVTTIPGISSNSKAGIGYILSKVGSVVLENFLSLTGCIKSNLEPGWFKSFLKQFNFIQKAFGIISNGANTTIFGVQWGMSRAVIDTCFGAVGNLVGECGGCDGLKSITDIDGNIYPVVKIGTQCWTAKNLQTTRYNDGTAIPNVPYVVEWTELWRTKTGAWVYYENESGYNSEYGKLYNWYAVGTGKLCPTGWRIPSHTDWTVLINFLGGESVAGGKMKTTGIKYWNSPNTGATNSSGFSGLPGGHRPSAFFSLRRSGYWWSSSIDEEFARQVPLFFDSEGILEDADPKTFGNSCRCLRN